MQRLKDAKVQRFKGFSHGYVISTKEKSHQKLDKERTLVTELFNEIYFVSRYRSSLLRRDGRLYVL